MKKTIAILIMIFALNIHIFGATSMHEYLSKAISAELNDEPFIVRVIYGEMLLNRLESKDYPDTLPAICFSLGINVSGAKPTPSDMRAASVALCGVNFSCGALNAEKAKRKSIPQAVGDGMLIYGWYFY